MKQTRKQILAGIVVATMIGVSFSAILSVSNAATSSSSGGTFVFGSPVDTTVADLNPLTVTNSLASILVKDMYANQLAYQWPSGAFSSWLARSWTVTDNANGTELISFHLNPNAQWENGSKKAGEITSADVLFTFQVLKDNLTLDAYQVTPHILSMYSQGNTTVNFLMSSQNILWFQYIATQTIIPSAWKAYDNGKPGNIGGYTNMGPFGQEITAGPFVLSSINAEGAKMLANPNFWMGKPKISTYYVEKYTSTATADLALEKGDISAVNPALSDYNALTSQTNISNEKQAAPYVFYLWMNDNVAPYNNTNFRIGISYALNKTRIMAKDEDGIGAAGANNMSDGGLPGVMKSDWAANLTYYGYNTTLANKMFLKAGYHIGSQGYYVNNTTGLQAQFLVQEPSAVADWVASGTTIANELQAVHIDAQVDVIPIGTWVSQDLNLSNFKQTTYFGYVPSVTNPYIQLEQAYYGYHNNTGAFISGPWNFENYSNPTVNYYLNRSANTTTQSQLLQNLSHVEKILDQQLPMIPMSNAYNYVAYNNALVKDFYDNLSIDDPMNLMNMTVVKSPVLNFTAGSTAGNNLYYYIGGGAAVVVVIALVAMAVTRSRRKDQK